MNNLKTTLYGLAAGLSMFFVGVKMVLAAYAVGGLQGLSVDLLERAGALCVSGVAVALAGIHAADAATVQKQIEDAQVAYPESQIKG